MQRNYVGGPPTPSRPEVCSYNEHKGRNAGSSRCLRFQVWTQYKGRGS